MKLTSLHDWISHCWDDLCLVFVSTSLDVLIAALFLGNVSLGLWMSKNWLHHYSLLLQHKLKILYQNTELGILFLHFVQQKQFISRHGWVIHINIPHLSTFYICNVEDIFRTRNLLTNCPPYNSANNIRIEQRKMHEKYLREKSHLTSYLTKL